MNMDKSSMEMFSREELEVLKQKFCRGRGQRKPGVYLCNQPESAKEAPTELWSPTGIKKGRRRTYNTAAEILAGETVIHVNQKGIVAVSTVMCCAHEADTPYKNNSLVKKYGDKGVAVRLRRIELKKAIPLSALADVTTNGRPHKGFDRTGSIHQGTYIERLDDELANHKVVQGLIELAEKSFEI